MGAGSSTIVIKYPTPTVTFGPGTEFESITTLNSNLREIQDILSNFKDVTEHITDLQDNVPWKNLQKFFTQITTTLGSLPSYVSAANSILQVLVQLTDNAEAELQRKLDSTAASVLVTIISGKLNALKSSLNCLLNPEISSVQKVAEVTTSINSLVEILSYFTSQDSILYKQYWIAAPIFVRIYIIAVPIIAIARVTPDYVNRGLDNFEGSLNAKLLDIEGKCIAARIRGTVLRVFTSGTEGRETDDFKREEHYELFAGYQIQDAALPNFRRKSAWPGQCYKVWDHWDTREDVTNTEKTCSKEEINNQAGLSLLDKWYGNQEGYKTLEFYRRDVVTVMRDFFQSARDISIT